MKIAVCVSGQLRDSWRDCISAGKICLIQTKLIIFTTWTNKTAQCYCPANKDTEEKEISNTEINSKTFA